MPSASSGTGRSEDRQREAAAIDAELAPIEQRLDDHEPLAQPDRDTPTRPMVNPRRNVERFRAGDGRGWSA